MPSSSLRSVDLTDGERLLIWRRRKGLTQAEAARDARISVHRWRRWEGDKLGPPRKAIGKLLPHEACLILRRRAGVKLGELAERMGVSAWWLCQMEAGRVPIDRLLRHWAA